MPPTEHTPIYNFSAWLDKFKNTLQQSYHEGIYQTERGVSRALGVNPSIFDYASRRPSEFGFEDSPINKRDYGDALRHILLAAELTRTAPYVAAPLLYGHEFISGVLHGQSPQARQMDIANNALGQQIGRNVKTREEMELQALLNLPRATTISMFDPTTRNR